MAALRIIGLCILAAVVYGIAHDQVTVRICVEYFTIGHPKIFATESPTLLAVGWGILATWWVGLLLGALLAFAALRGNRPKRSVRSLVRPIAILLAVMAACSLLAGLVGYALAANGVVVLMGSLAANVPADRHAPLIAALWAHSASYLAGFVGGIVLASRVWRSRRHEPFSSPEDLDNFITETRARMHAQGLGAASGPLEEVQNTGYTSSSEWLGDLGAAVRDIEARCTLSPDIAARLARIRAVVRGVWPLL